MSKIRKIKGFTDLFPPDSTAFSFMEATARAVFERYGFAELRTPIVEKTELFARSIGDETDVVSKEMYTFDDRKGRSLTLRPEATAGVARAYIDSGPTQGQVAKYYTFGPMFRYERPQSGRQRQFHQINAEILGSSSAHADAELILMLHAFLAELGLTGLAVELNSLGCPQCRPRFHQALTSHFAGLAQDAMCPDCLRRMKTNPLRVLDCKVPGCREELGETPVISDHLCSSCRDHFSVVTRVLKKAGVSYRLNPMLVRGLDYYQRTTFEVVADTIGAQSSVAGGGRYDGLVKQLGGPDVPGTGFACGMERLAMLLAQTPDTGQDFYLAVLEESGLDQGLILAQNLRDKGLCGQVSYESRSMKALMRAADKLHVKHALILGPDELQTGRVTVRDMATGDQRTVTRDDLASFLADPDRPTG